MNSKGEKIAIVIFILLTIVIFIGFSYLEPKDKTVINAVSVYGSFCSIFGLVIAYLQILKIKTSTEETQKAVLENTERFNKIFSTGEVSKAIKIVEEIQIYIRRKEFQLAILRMKDLKEILIQAKSVKELSRLTDSKIFKSIIHTLTDDLNNVTNYAENNKYEINFSIVNKNLEGISTILITFKHKIRNHG